MPVQVHSQPHSNPIFNGPAMSLYHSDRVPLDELPPWGDQFSSCSSSRNSSSCKTKPDASSSCDRSRSPLASTGNRVVLLGDALHAVHPGPGQGARSAFEVI